MRIVLFGHLGADDGDDDAALRCVARSLRRRDPGGTLTLVALAAGADRELGLEILSLADDRTGAAIAAADLVVVAGGALWSAVARWQPGDPFAAVDAGGIRTLLAAKALGVRSAIFASGLRTLPTPAAHRSVASLASLAVHVSVRDDESADALRAAGFRGGVMVTADPLFAVDPDPAVVVPPRQRPLRIGVVPGGAPDAELAAALTALAARHALEVVLVSTSTTASSRQAAERWRATLSPSLDDLRTVLPATAEEASRWLGTCDVVVTMRLDGAILAAVAGTPAVAIGDDPALQSHARMLGCADLALDSSARTADAIARRVEQALEARATIATQLAARVEVARTVLDAGYEALIAAAAGSVSDPPAPDGQLAALEQVCARLRSRLEQREESWRTLASVVGRDVEAVAPVSTGGRQRSRDIQVLTDRAEAAETELAAIKRSRGWRLLHQYGVFKYHYVWPVLRFFGRKKRPDAPTSEAGDDPAPVVIPPGTYDVVCFPIIDWDFRFQRPQQLMSRFAAAGHRVFYVAPRFEEPGSAPVVVEKAPNVYHVTLAGLPRNVWTQALDLTAREQLLQSLDRLRVEWGLGATLACVQLPFWWPLAALARERFAWPTIYDCMDDHAGFSTFTGATVDDEDELFRSADLVVASSTLLAEQARRRTDTVLLLRNACEYDHFATAGAARKRGSRPVIGYYGAIADWFDADLVADLAERRPEWDFVLVGSTDTGDVSRLATLPNVRLPGEQPYAEIPRWLATFDVTLLPFKRTPLTEATNPVKAYEILAAGKPLVSVPLPEMRELGSLVRLAATAPEFEHEILAALAPDDAAHVEARRRFARANTWQARFDELHAVVPALFPTASTVIVTYNNLAMNQGCLANLFARTDWPSHEVIVVDNASSDGTREYLQRLAAERDDVVVILNDDNRGFAAGCNQGLARATGAYLVLLNNDTVVTRGWLSTLIRHLHAVPEIGLVGPVTNEIGNESKIPVGYADLDAMPAWAARYTREHDDRLRSMHTLAMFCVAMRRDTYAAVGPLDERFAIGMFEDDDYSRRMQRQGYRLVAAHDSFIHHFGGASFKRLDQGRYRDLFERNKRTYERKWGPWTPHQDDTALPRIEMLSERLATIVEQARVRPDQIVVFLRLVAEPAEHVDRMRELATTLARSGMLVFLDGTSSLDGTQDGFRQLEPNLWQYSGPRGTLEHLQTPILWALPYNALDAFRWLAHTIVYDVSDEPAGFRFDASVLHENHDRMLREADLVVYGAATAAIAARRSDAVLLAAPSEVASLVARGRAPRGNGSGDGTAEQRVPAHAARFAGHDAYRGTCNVCGHTTRFYFEDAALYRESLTCGDCLTTSRYRSITRGILRAIGELTGVTATSLAALSRHRPSRRLRIYDTQLSFYYERNAYPLPDLLAACEWIEVHTSTLRPREPLGAVLGDGRSNQNLEHLTFPDAFFDLVITSDVMEHVRLHERAHHEIRRVLAPDGAYVFTVPHHRDPFATTTRVVVADADDPARDVFVMEPEYHGDANSEGNAALSYRIYGRDLDVELERLGFGVEYAKEDLPELGILNTELFYCKVVRPIDSVGTDTDTGTPA